MRRRAMVLRGPVCRGREKRTDSLCTFLKQITLRSLSEVVAVEEQDGDCRTNVYFDGQVLASAEAFPSTCRQHPFGKRAANVNGHLRRDVAALEVHRIDAAQKVDEHVVEISVWIPDGNIGYLTNFAALGKPCLPIL